MQIYKKYLKKRNKQKRNYVMSNLLKMGAFIFTYDISIFNRLLIT